jgi:hypothetical protein
VAVIQPVDHTFRRTIAIVLTYACAAPALGQAERFGSIRSSSPRAGEPAGGD